MRITIKTLERIAEEMNRNNGVSNKEIGSIVIYKDGLGYAIHIIRTSGYGVTSVESCMTARECYYALNGDVERKAKEIIEGR